MDFLQKIGNFLHQAYCWIAPEASSCAAPAQEAASSNPDQFQPLPPLQSRRLEEIVSESHQVRVGCYIEMHQVHSGEMLIRRRPFITQGQLRQLEQALRQQLQSR